MCYIRDMKKSEITLSQANTLTQSRYNFSVVEKRAVYFIIKEVRRQFIEHPGGQKDLFDDLIIRMDTKALQGSDTVLRDVYNAMKRLRQKSIWIEDDKRVLEVGYINYFEHMKGSDSLEVQVSHKILPFLVELAEQFTSYKLTVAISLKNKYSQRFYEYCSQFKSTKFFYIPIEELRKKLMIEDKYPRYALLKQRVLEPAKKELKALYDSGQCDLFFNYKEDKSGRTVNGLKIFITTAEEQEQKEEMKMEDLIFYLRTWLNSWLNTSRRPKNKKWVDNVIKHLQLNPDLIPKLYDRLVRMQEKESSGNYAPLARHIIEEDFL